MGTHSGFDADGFRAFSAGFVNFKIRAVDPAVSDRRFKENGRTYRELVDDGLDFHTEDAVHGAAHTEVGDVARTAVQNADVRRGNMRVRTPYSREFPSK